MSKFKVGDKVKRINVDFELAKVGTILTVSAVHFNGDIQVEEHLDARPHHLYAQQNFELVECELTADEMNSGVSSNRRGPPTLRQGDKFDSGKPQMRFLTKEFLEGTALAQTYGSKKYGPWNFQKGLEYSAMYDAAIRHMMAWFHAEATDPESGYSHLAHAAANLNMLMWMEANKPEMDDRPKRASKELTEEEKYEAAKAIQERGR